MWTTKTIASLNAAWTTPKASVNYNQGLEPTLDYPKGIEATLDYPIGLEPAAEYPKGLEPT